MKAVWVIIVIVAVAIAVQVVIDVSWFYHRASHQTSMNTIKVPYFPPIQKNAADVAYAYQFEFQNHKFEVRKWRGTEKFQVKMDGHKVFYPQWEGKVGKSFRNVYVGGPNVSLTNDGTSLYLGGKGVDLTIDAGLRETLYSNAQIEVLDGKWTVYSVTFKPVGSAEDDQNSLYETICQFEGKGGFYQLTQHSSNPKRRDLILQFLRTFKEVL